MNALGAIVRFDRIPVDAAVVRALAATTDGLHPQPGESLNGGWFVLARAGASLVPRDDAVPAPFTTRDDGLSVLFEGRLDNREELAASLAATAFVPVSRADAHVFAAAAQAWDREAWARLLGDFAAVVVDHRRRRVTAIRDAFGIRPLLYRRLPGGVAFATNVAALARLGPVTPDEAFIGEHLAGGVSDLACTACREVRRVPPRHAMTFDADGECSECYDVLLPDPIDRTRSDADYEDELRSLLRESTHARLRGGRAGIFVSGGIDSAVIAASARGHRSSAQITTYSLTFPGALENEQPWSDAVVAHLGFAPAHTRVSVAEVPFEYAGFARRTLQPPPAPNGLASVLLRRRAQADGVRTLLTGIGSDEIFTGSWLRYADLLARGRLPSLFREWRQDRHHPMYEGNRYALISAIGPHVPMWLRPLARRIARIDPVPAAIAPRFAARINLADRLRLRPLPAAFEEHAQSEVWRQVTDGTTVTPLEQEQMWAAMFGADQRFPYLDRRIVRFALRLPEPQRWSNATAKVVLRRAFADQLPPEITGARRWFDYTFVLIPALRRLLAAHGSRRWLVVEHGWVDDRQLNALIATVQRGDDRALGARPRVLWRLWNIVSIEILAEAFEGARADQPDAVHFGLRGAR